MFFIQSLQAFRGKGQDLPSHPHSPIGKVVIIQPAVDVERLVDLVKLGFHQGITKLRLGCPNFYGTLP